MRYIPIVLLLASLLAISTPSTAQIKAPKFGSGLQITAQDSSFYMRIGFRFQTLFQSAWNLDDNTNENAVFIRRSRLKFDGYALTPRLKYKAELALSNRDNGGGNSSRFSNAANIILDAFIEWNFHENLSIVVGQTKFPGNRERIISSGNLQFVDRSRLNSRFTLDRDVGIMLKNKSKLGGKFILKQVLAIGSGEGKNITGGNIGGHAYSAKLEGYPFGEFASKGDYVGADLKREATPKLAIAAAYEINVSAGRTRGQTGSFFTDGNDNPFGKNLNTFFADFIYKHKGLSIMGEYANRRTDDGDPFIIDGEGIVIDNYYTGSATNLSVGNLFTDTFEAAVRWTNVQPDDGVDSPENQYTFGLSKYIVGHKLKVQTDVTFRDREFSDNEFTYRLQMDLHF